MPTGSSNTFFGDFLSLFAASEVYIYVFMEIVTKLDSVQRVIFKKAELRDNIFFTILFGLFSIFGTLIGNQSGYGVISNIRDLSPIVAGLIGGPYLGVGVGLIGSIHRLSVGGDFAIPCSIATVFAGLFAGIIFHFKKGVLLEIIPAMIFGAAFEIFHGVMASFMVKPFNIAVELFLSTAPNMIVANSLGIAICIIILRSRVEEGVKLHSK